MKLGPGCRMAFRRKLHARAARRGNRHRSRSPKRSSSKPRWSRRSTTSQHTSRAAGHRLRSNYLADHRPDEQEQLRRPRDAEPIRADPSNPICSTAVAAMPRVSTCRRRRDWTEAIDEMAATVRTRTAPKTVRRTTLARRSGRGPALTGDILPERPAIAIMWLAEASRAIDADGSNPHRPQATSAGG